MVNFHDPDADIIPVAVDLYSSTFYDYFNEKVGVDFEPRLKFDMLSSDFSTLNFRASRADVQLVYSHASVFSCLESSVGMSPLATISKWRLGTIVCAHSSQLL